MHRLAEHVDQPPGDGSGAASVVVGQHHHELVAADTAGERLGPQRSADAIGEGDEELVAAAMAEQVVHGLETVEVDEQHTHRSIGRGEQVVEGIERTATVQQSGERIVERQELELLVRGAQRGVGVG